MVPATDGDDAGRNDNDRFLSRNNFVSLSNEYGLLRIGRLAVDNALRCPPRRPSPTSSTACHHYLRS